MEASHHQNETNVRLGNRGMVTMSRGWQKLLACTVAGLLCLASFGLGVAAGPSVQLAMGVPTIGERGLPIEFRTLLQVWSLVSTNYVDQRSVNPKTMAYAAIDAMLATLKDTGHTRFLTANQYRQQEEEFQGQFSGIGATVDVQDHHPIIVVPMPNEPAAKAGLLPGDMILAIDGRDTTDMPLPTATALIRGQAGSVVRFLIRRGAAAPFSVSVVRAVIPIVSIHWQLVPGTQIADIAISSFSDGTAAKLQTAMAAARAQGATRFIVDVRNDPGGLLNQAVDVSSLFIPNGVILIEANAHGHQVKYRAKGDATVRHAPVVVLTNKNTASAAEIFAGAMQENQRARIIGQRTLGTGTVLSTYLLKDGSALLLGTQEWLTPQGQSIKDHGITPNERVVLASGGAVIQPGGPSFPASETAALSSNDAQLAAAIKALSTASVHSTGAAPRRVS